MSSSVSSAKQQIVFTSPEGLQLEEDETISAVHFGYPVTPKDYPVQVKPDRSWLYRMGGKDWATPLTASHYYPPEAKRVRNTNSEVSLLTIPLPSLFGKADDALSVQIFGQVFNQSSLKCVLRIRIFLISGSNEYLLGSASTANIDALSTQAIFASLDIIYDLSNEQTHNYMALRRAAYWEVFQPVYRLVQVSGVNVGQASLDIRYTLSVANENIYADLYNFRATFLPQTLPQPV